MPSIVVVWADDGLVMKDGALGQAMEQVQPPRGLNKDYVKIEAGLVECESDEFKAVKHRVDVRD